MNKEDNLLFSSSFRMSKILVECGVVGEKEMIFRGEEQLRLELADYIQDVKSETHNHNDFIERRLEVYVATPDEFWNMVNEKAMEIIDKYPRPVITNYD